MNTPSPSGSPPDKLSEAKRKLLAERLRGSRTRAGAAETAIPAIPRDQPLHASPGQQGVYVAHQIDPTSAGFNVPSSFLVHGPLDVELLTRAVNHVVARHEVLRTNYRYDGEQIELLIRPSLEIRIRSVSCAGFDEMRSKGSEFVRGTFDLEDDPLLRLRHFHQPDGPSLLSLVVHDMVFDKWSLGNFWKETAAVYRALAAGASPELPALAIQFADFAAWHRSRLDSGERGKQLAYWQSQLRDLPAPLPLPTDFPFPDTPTTAGALERAPLRPDLTKALKLLAAENNTTLFSVLLAAYQILLQRLCGTDDIAVATPVANRRKPETAELIGFLLSVVAIRSRLDDHHSFLELLRQVTECSLGALENQDVPFDHVLEAVKPPRVPGRYPGCQVMFVYQREHEAAPSADLGEAKLVPNYIDTGTSKLDLTLFTAESGEGMETIAEYRSDLFAPATIREFLRRYTQLLTAIVANPGAPIGSLSLLTAEEEAALLTPPTPLPEPIPLPDQIARCAAETPDAPAIRSSEGSFTYREVLARADSLAGRLVRDGARPDSPVAIFLPRSLDALVAVLGILRAGAPYLVLDPAYPRKRTEEILRDAAPSIVVTSPEHAGSLASPAECRVVTLPVDDAPPAELPGIAPDHLAYILYTSGSTGTPKGVTISHRNLFHSNAARSSIYPSTPGSFLLLPNLAFDSSVAGIFWTLSTGGQLVVPDAGDERDPDLIADLMARHEVTTLLCVPTLYRELLRTARPGKLASLRTAIVAGEACPPDLVETHHHLIPDTSLYNEYGPTEATVWATAKLLERGRPVTIGTPIPGAQAFVLDARQRLLPPGVPGELYLGGPGLAPGYLHNPELTEERFPSVTLAPDHTFRLYRTGDLTRWNADHELEFLGRNDEQLKIRGHRVEAGEIEAALDAHPAIAEAAVTLGRSAPDLQALLSQATPEQLAPLLAEVHALGAGPERRIDRSSFHLELHTSQPDFIAPPRKAQRDWLLGQAMAEFADDLEHLDEVAPRFVRGHDHQLGDELRDIADASLTDDEIMEDWQVPLMRAMARAATESHGDILEIGFGRGVAAQFIQDAGVRSHTVIEMNEHSVEHYFKPWRAKHPDREIGLHHARWQDVVDQLPPVDGILFHAFPMNEAEFTEYVLESVTFAEHAFAPMAALLKPGGCFTYLTTEIDSLSRRHQRLLFRHFSSLSLHVEPVRIPADTRDTWWADSMVVIKAVK